MKEHGKNPQEHTNKESIGSLLPPQKNQSNDSKNDLKSWKYKGGTDN